MGYRLNRVLRRILNVFDSEAITWECESCNRCGICYRLPYRMKDEVWVRVVGHEGGLLCFDCFIRTAEEKGVEIKLEDIESLWVFQAEGHKCFDIVGGTND